MSGFCIETLVNHQLSKACFNMFSGIFGIEGTFRLIDLIGKKRKAE